MCANLNARGTLYFFIISCVLSCLIVTAEEIFWAPEHLEKTYSLQKSKWTQSNYGNPYFQTGTEGAFPGWREAIELDEHN